MSSSNIPTASDYATLIKGILGNISPKASIVLSGQTFTPAQLCALFQDRIDKNAATSTARSEYHAAVKEERAAEAEVRPLRLAFKSFITGQLGASSEDLTKYSFNPRNPKQPDTATKALAAAQAVATRKARNPLTKEEKKKIRGVVPAQTTTTPAAATPASSTLVAGAPVTVTPQATVATNGTAQTNGH